MDQKLIQKGKEAKSAKELKEMAHNQKIELSDEQADHYYSLLHPAEGELSKSELSNVSGDVCGDDVKYKKVSERDTCSHFAQEGQDIYQRAMYSGPKRVCKCCTLYRNGECHNQPL
jgi:hypothetical protein